MTANYEAEQAELEEKIAQLEETDVKSKENAQNALGFTELIRKCVNIKELDIELVNALIDRIVVYDADKVSKTQKIEIYYKFVGAIAD
ncbi:MAG: DUF4368 domain-containing protein [Ruminococcus sp.]|nr:DUF4368 domain-containing protein [Ruminococcus sp.]